MPQANFSDPKHPLIKPIKFVPVFRTDEKGSDVNLAVQLVNDAWLDDYDCAVVVSNDSDLQEALKIIKNQKKKIGVCIPGDETRVRPSKELIKYADFTKHIRKHLLQNSQLPNPIPGTSILKPLAW
jgi:uncharacterized LabA/DUF88 family protein